MKFNDLGDADPSLPLRPSRGVFFTRGELTLILRVYGRMVAAGEWRDYAMDSLPDHSIFSVFRRTSEVPLYRIEKRPALAQRQGAFSVVASGGLILRRGRELEAVLRVFDRQLLKIAPD
ncbi:MAG: DUF2794 domain-containing protein [Caulobacterales bacterium]